MSPEYESALLERAAGGDRDAAGEYLSHLLPMLGRIARRTSNGAIDPDDLLSEAITQLLQRWLGGVGPKENVVAYLATSMRNRVIDEYRSPRSWQLPLEEHDATEENPFATVDLQQEVRWLTRALENLPEDQRTVLTESVLHEAKPRELSESLGRPASAISSLKRRARLNLRRQFLRQILEDNAPKKCARAAAALPEVVHDDFDKTTGSGSGMRHIRQCPRCRSAWGVFASVGGAIGSFAMLLSWSPQLVETSLAAAPGAAQQLGGPGVEAQPRASRTGSKTASQVLLVAGVVTVGAGVAGLVAQVMSSNTGNEDPAHPAMVSVSVEQHERSGLSIGLDFSLYERTSDSETLTLTLSPETKLVSAPGHWDCTEQVPSFVCTTTRPAISKGTFHFARADSEGTRPSFTLELVSELDEVIYVAEFAGEFPDPSRILKTTIHSDPEPRQ